MYVSVYLCITYIMFLYTLRCAAKLMFYVRDVSETDEAERIRESAFANISLWFK